jgi:hypothetical protein
MSPALSKRYTAGWLGASELRCGVQFQVEQTVRQANDLHAHFGKPAMTNVAAYLTTSRVRQSSAGNFRGHYRSECVVRWRFSWPLCSCCVMLPAAFVPPRHRRTFERV